ncbi:hypothetical protein [Nonomuraea fuscirosea]|uniref:hypothetical protein n=1 Tax=Nonomuraea fuscirosea TaxID=1291556 RepID=UPI0033DCF9F2
MTILKPARPAARTAVSNHNVVKTPAFHNLERNLEYVHQLISAGKSLATFAPANLDVGDLYRAAWVQAIAALDYWVSQEIYSRAIRLAQEPEVEKPKKFREFAIPMAVFEDVHHYRVPLEEALGQHLRKFVSKTPFNSRTASRMASRLSQASRSGTGLPRSSIKSRPPRAPRWMLARSRSDSTKLCSAEIESPTKQTEWRTTIVAGLISPPKKWMML